MDEIPGALKDALAHRYELRRIIGHGGMATVYLASDPKHRRDVAIKVLRPELAQSLGTQRFLNEIEIAARLTHPHVLPLYDSGEDGGFLYYVMPFVNGESLRDMLYRRARLPVDAVLLDGAYPDDAAMLELIDQYDATYAGYLNQRGADPTRTWSSAMAQKFAEPRRAHLASFYASKGADLT